MNLFVEIKFRFSRYNENLNVTPCHIETYIEGIFFYYILFLLKEEAREGNETGQDYDGENDAQGFKNFSFKKKIRILSHADFNCICMSVKPF